MEFKIRFLKWLDGLLGKHFIRLFPGVEKRPWSGEGRVLIIRPGGIGDAVLVIPMIETLKEEFPDVQIEVLAESRNAGVFALCPNIEKVLRYDSWSGLWKVISRKYTLVIDTEQWHRLSAIVARLAGAGVSIGFSTNEREQLFQYPISYKQDRYEMNSFLDLLSPLLKSDKRWARKSFLHVPEKAARGVSTMLAPLNGCPFVTVFPGASIPERRWGWDKYVELARRLEGEGMGVVVVGGASEASVGERIVKGGDGLNLAGRTSLVETAAILEKSKLLISSDSGVLHIGVGLNVPTVSLFGPGIVEKWGPSGERHQRIRKELPCSPCTLFGTTPPCPRNVICMAGIVVDEVFEAALTVLAKGREE